MQNVSAAQFLPRDGGHQVAYHRQSAAKGRLGPGLVFLGGFMSDMSGTKAIALEAYAADRGCAFLRFDYLGHGLSSGAFEEGTIGRWKDDALAALDHLTDGPQVLVGSSMGGWISLLVARERPERVAGLVGIAAAPDFTQAMWRGFNPGQRNQLMNEGRLEQPSDYSDEPYIITRDLIEDGRKNLLLDGPIPISCPVRLLQGQKDEAVPWETAQKISDALASDDVEVTIVKGGDHRLSEPHDLDRLNRTLDRLFDLLQS
ncbi:MAG: alpha/beta hydrolase [Pseudomonadota bacterium]